MKEFYEDLMMILGAFRSVIPIFSVPKYTLMVKIRFLAIIEIRSFNNFIDKFNTGILIPEVVWTIWFSLQIPNQIIAILYLVFHTKNNYHKQRFETDEIHDFDHFQEFYTLYSNSKNSFAFLKLLNLQKN